jgi:hypothetical protein
MIVDDEYILLLEGIKDIWDPSPIWDILKDHQLQEAALNFISVFAKSLQANAPKDNAEMLSLILKWKKLDHDARKAFILEIHQGKFDPTSDIANFIGVSRAEKAAASHLLESDVTLLPKEEPLEIDFLTENQGTQSPAEEPLDITFEESPLQIQLEHPDQTETDKLSTAAKEFLNTANEERKILLLPVQNGRPLLGFVSRKLEHLAFLIRDEHSTLDYFFYNLPSEDEKNNLDEVMHRPYLEHLGSYQPHVPFLWSARSEVTGAERERLLQELAEHS